MKNRLFLMIIVCGLILPQNIYSQVGSLIKKKIKSETSRETEKEVESKALSITERLIGATTIEESRDTVLTDESMEEEIYREESVVNPMSVMLTTGYQSKHKEVYKFDGKIVMEMESSDDEETEFEGTILYTTYINTSNSDFAMEMRPVTGDDSVDGQVMVSMIYDQDNQIMMMLTRNGDQKLAIVSSTEALDEMNDIMETEDEEDTFGEPGQGSLDDYTIEKTGTTKNILGYKCDGYTATNENEIVNIWVSRDVPFTLLRDQMTKAGMPIFYDSMFEDGMVMEMEMFRDGIKKGYMVVKEINSKAEKSISLNGYSFIGTDQ